MPALLTTASMRPKLSIAAWTIDAAAASSETSANTATASPPASRIASHDLVRGLRRRARPVEVHAVVGDHDLRAPRRQQLGVTATEASARSGHDHGLSVESQLVHVPEVPLVGACRSETVPGRELDSSPSVRRPTVGQYGVGRERGTSRATGVHVATTELRPDLYYDPYDRTIRRGSIRSSGACVTKRRPTTTTRTTSTR